MFTGIVQALSPVLMVKTSKGEKKIKIQRPGGQGFSDLKTGDSLALNGVCLTIESLTAKTLGFHLSFETLNITGWDKESLQGRQVNLEPALRVGDFVGGHFVTGHVDGQAEVINVTAQGESRWMSVRVPTQFKKYFWKKGFINLNGVSLTINEIKGDKLILCLVPETLKRTNLKDQEPGCMLTFEVDSHARALLSSS